MSKTHTIKVPVVDGDPVEVTGKLALLYVGEYQYSFLLQDSPHGEVFLTHFISGQRLGSLTPIKLQHRYQRMTDREAAKLLIEHLINIHGVKAVQEKLDNTPTINES